MTEKRHLDSIRRTLRQHLPDLARNYLVKSLGIFGSYVRSEQDEESDLDLLVTFHEAPGLLAYIELESYLSNLLGVKVDLVMESAWKPRIGKRILAEVVPL
jgi:uncharacterized protein